MINYYQQPIINNTNSYHYCLLEIIPCAVFSIISSHYKWTNYTNFIFKILINTPLDLLISFLLCIKLVQFVFSRSHLNQHSVSEPYECRVFNRLKIIISDNGIIYLTLSFKYYFSIRAVYSFFSFINLLTNFILIATAKFLKLLKTILKL